MRLSGCLALCVLALATPAAAAPTFAVKAGLFPPAPTLAAGSRNDNAEPGIAVDGAGAFYAAANIGGFDPAHDSRGAGESGIDIWRSLDRGRTYKWVAAPFNAMSHAPGVGGLDADIAAARYPNAQHRYNVYAVTTAFASLAPPPSDDR